MIKKIWLINGALLVLTAMVGLNIFDVWSGRNNRPGLGALPKTEIPAAPSFNPVVRKAENTYQAVVAKNLFSPDRREVQKAPPPPPPPPENKPVVEPEKPVQVLEKVEGKPIMLYGVILLPNYRAAIITNPETKDNPREQKKVNIGEMIGEYKIVDIQKERILLDRKQERFEIVLFDKNNPKERKVTVKPAVVRKDAAPTVITARPEPEKPKPTEKASKTAEKEQWEIVDTPFGKMKRPKR